MRYNCTNCGAEFRRKPSQIKSKNKDKQFCSASCVTLYRFSKTKSNENIVYDAIKANKKLMTNKELMFIVSKDVNNIGTSLRRLMDKNMINRRRLTVEEAGDNYRRYGYWV